MPKSNNRSLVTTKKTSARGRCLACGLTGLDKRRRYCSNECRNQILWVLSLSKGFLSIFNTRYAAFSFNSNYVILDILASWSKDISRFAHKRSFGKKPAHDLKALILNSGREWYNIIGNNNSRSYASLSLLNRNATSKVHPSSIKPSNKVRPRFSKDQKKSLSVLQMELKELVASEKKTSIKSAYKRLAKVHHPDMGGSEEDFKQLNEAHEQMLLWAENPLFTSRKALIDCWSFDADSNRWAPPL